MTTREPFFMCACLVLSQVGCRGVGARVTHRSHAMVVAHGQRGHSARNQDPASSAASADECFGWGPRVRAPHSRPQETARTRADADLRNTKFFANVDWNAVASQQGPPALAVGADCVARRDRESALAAYRARAAAHKEEAELGAASAENPSPPPLPREESVEGRNSAGGSKDYGSNGGHNNKEPWYFGLPVVAGHPEITPQAPRYNKEASNTNKAA